MVEVVGRYNVLMCLCRSVDAASVNGDRIFGRIGLREKMRYM